MRIVFDSSCNLYGEKIFSYEFCKKIIGGSWLSYFYRLAQINNIEIILAEKYLQEEKFSSNDVIISEAFTSNSTQLLATGAYPLIIYSGESPNVDWRFYSAIYKNTKPYKHAILFPGFKKHISKNITFDPYNWPNDPANAISNEEAFLNKNFKKKLVMIAGNKKQNISNSGNLLKTFLRTIGMTVFTTFAPAMKLTDLYSFRMKAIIYFSTKNYFDLYGKHWNKHKLLTKKEQKVIQLLNPAEIDNKYTTLSKYQFSLCFENCIYNGYITEKIFDCFFSKSIPIYLGAPDIDQYIPKNTFIDMRNFTTFKELDIFLEHLSEEKISEYLHNIERYLNSVDFLKFTDQKFAQKLFDITYKHFHTY